MIDTPEFRRICSLIMSFNKLSGIVKHPLKADNEFYQATSVISRRRRIYARIADYRLSKINTDYETSRYAAMASFIIHIYF